MRRIGLVLLGLGFCWLLGLQLVSSVRGGIRPVLRAQFSQIDASPQSSFSKQDMEELARRTAQAAFDAQPLFVLPGLLMLLGGVLTARSGTARHGTTGSAQAGQVTGKPEGLPDADHDDAERRSS